MSVVLASPPAQDTAITYVKTDAGNSEVKTRSLKLPQRVRTMLILIDGTASAAQLREAGARIGVQDDFIDLLTAHGLITALPLDAGRGASRREAPAANEQAALPEAERFEAARKFMNDTVVDALGIRAFFFTLKVEKCFTRADLAALLPDYTKAITKGSGPDVARALTAEAQRKLR